MSFNPGSYSNASVIWGYNDRTLTQMKLYKAEDSTEYSTTSTTPVDGVSITITAPSDRGLSLRIFAKADIKTVATGGTAYVNLVIDQKSYSQSTQSTSYVRKYFGLDSPLFFILGPGESITVKIQYYTDNESYAAYISNQSILVESRELIIG
ncbi:MAG: hypothetical protein GSR72_00285 [Desulfurococcales archaeon]|nr:hypothetical protein [Desulfurococcales archaeon]